ncbi:membrane-bound serine protease (ClpP class) [Cyclobacterium lianum]|uniref:Membrane-bound serine protease (ClpP class) n=1 Tax=Cyclobacterium lianum TaxID=388280 RepID=A0A1M7IZ09_9BACT|nr:NfeD family protein [Cyclobacterium lianum]SHM45935.1 membrane-bound serine protease (ClpP class) [Cyclobacterium lianum]
MKLVFGLMLYAFVVFEGGTIGFAQEDGTVDSLKTVYVLEMKSDIDPRMNRKVKLALEDAAKREAVMIIVHMDTYGGAVTDADEIRTLFLESPVPIHSFIDKDAASAGALISIACDSIYMARGGSIGAATVVMGGTGEAAPDKYQSYMRSIMRSTAEARGRDPRIAEAMVDEDIEIEEISEAGEVVTFSVSEAIQHGFCEAEVSSIDEIVERNGIQDYEIHYYSPSVVEDIISFFLNPAVSGFLILVIFAGIYFEIQTPGIGFPLAASGIAILLYFIPYYLTGLASNLELVIFVAGVILLAVEIFVIPGFGVFGILGIICILAGLTMGMLPNEQFDFTFVSSGKLFTALLTVIVSAIVATVLIFSITPKINQWESFSRLSLSTTQQKTEGYTSSFYSDDLLGKQGIAHTRLMPSGRVLIDDEMYDAYSRGEFIDKGEKIQVISTEGTSLKVKKIVV